MLGTRIQYKTILKSLANGIYKVTRTSLNSVLNLMSDNKNVKGLIQIINKLAGPR